MPNIHHIYLSENFSVFVPNIKPGYDVFEKDNRLSVKV